LKTHAIHNKQKKAHFFSLHDSQVDQYFICRDYPAVLSAQVTFKDKRMMSINEVVKQDWHPAHVVAAVHVKGFTLRALSVEAGLSRDSLKNALYRKCPKYERIIAEAIGVAPEDIWPSRYARKVA
jgi:Ner family transcriptional regulator